MDNKNLLARMDILSERVVQIEYKLENLIKIVGGFGREQRDSLHSVAGEHQIRNKVPLRRKGYSIRTAFCSR